jgi:hypothetical protein
MAMRCGFALMLLVTLAGCNGGPSVNEVTGKVTLDGTAIEGATVTFQPIAGGTGKPAVGTTDANGQYKVTDMTSTKIGGGAVAGEYRVAVLWYKPTGADTSSSTGSESAVDSKASRTTIAGPTALLPNAYLNPETSGLTASVKKGPNNFDFPLVSTYKPGK